jgi:DNA gyrase subunit A
MLTVSANGYGKRTPVEEYRRQGRGGSGIINMRASKRNGDVKATLEVRDDDHLLIITAKGKIIRMNVAGISRIGRATQGVRVIQLDEGDVVVSAIRAAETAERPSGEPDVVEPQTDEPPVTEDEPTESDEPETN